MTDVRTATADLLEEKPELEDGLREVLAVDADQETWTFDDIPLDSGAFGELVSRGIVEKIDGEYAVADRDGVAAGLGVEAASSESDASGDGASSHGSSLASASIDVPSLSSVTVDRRVAIALSGAVLLVFLFRIIPFPAVFRGGDVVLSGNDPYAYRYVVHQLLAQSANPLDFSVLSSLPSGMAHGEPLMVATLWWVSAVFGGASAVGGVLAWYPVVSAVVTALMVYVLTVRVTEDRRAGIAAVALLAIIPAHAFRTGLGFADHHAFDYPWLALTALSVVSLAGRDLRDRRTWGWVGALGVGVGGQTLAWDAGPLLLVPLGLYALVVVPARLRADRSSLRDGVPFLAGIGLGAVLTLGAHFAFGWHTTAVIVAPVLLFGGVVGVFGLGTLARRFEVGVRSVVAIEVVGGVVGLIVLRQVLPAFSAQLDRGIDFLLSTGGIAETMSLVSGDLGTIVGPIFLFGFALFLAVPYLAWGFWRGYRDGSPKWLVTSAYGWYFLLLALVQIRFGGQLAIFTAVFAGLGLVHVAWWVDLASVPAPFERDDSGSSPVLANGSESGSGPDGGDLEWPERREAMYTAALSLGVGSLGGLMTPIKHSQLTVDDSMYEAAKFMREYSEERGWEYPENYVFSKWGRNRVYNWIVNGESRSYRFAQSNFGDFLASSDGEEWYTKLRDKVGFVVVSDSGSGGVDGTLHNALANRWGDGFGHYRALWTDSNQSRTVYSLVSGAIVASRLPNQKENITTEVDVNGVTVTYEAGGQETENGWYAARVPYPGTYSVGDQNVTVTKQDVREGRITGERSGTAHWKLNEGRGDFVFDSEGGNHGVAVNGSWTDGRKDLAFEATGESYVRISHDESISGRGGFTVSAWIRTDPNVDYREQRRFPRLVAKARASAYRKTNGYQIAMSAGQVYGFLGEGSTVLRLAGPQIDDHEWHRVALTWDGSLGQLFLDGKRTDSGVYEHPIQNSQPLVFGASSDAMRLFKGRIAEVRFQNKAIDPTE